MVFNSFNFLVFYPLLFLLYYVIPQRWHKVRNLFLLSLSYILYMNWKPFYALILLYVTIVTFVGARRFSKSNKKAKLLLTILVLLSAGPLIFFKYYNFLTLSISDFLHFVGLGFDLPGLNLAVPIGISFFTFQALGYLWDVYYKRIQPENRFLDYALFVSFFPSIVAGPINKASLILPQIKSLRQHFDYDKVVGGMKMFLWGVFMKVVVADRLCLYVDSVLNDYINHTAVTCLFACLLYSIQIYADFAGYSLMAIGVGKTLGFDLTENFRRPYFAFSVTDFWRRWHISLSTWLKDYVYIPMGGNRCSKVRNYWNIIFTFFVSGIWHGANWTFIVWGVLHGIFQVIEKALGEQRCNYGIVGKTIKIFVTFFLVSFAWIFFRMPTLDDAINIICKILQINSSNLFVDVQTLGYSALGVFLLLFKDIKDEWFSDKIKLMNNKSCVLRWLVYLSLTSLIILTGVFGSDQFIYANF